MLFFGLNFISDEICKVIEKINLLVKGHRGKYYLLKLNVQ